MATDPRQILTEIHGREVGLNHKRQLVCKNGYIIEGTPGAILEFDQNGIAVESPVAYGQYSSTVNQVPVANNTPLQVTNSMVETSMGLTHVPDEGITIQSAGRYQMLVGAQVAKASGSAQRTLHLWLRKNNVDIPRAAAAASITSLDSTVLVLNYLDVLNVGDNIKIYISTPDISGGIGLYATTPAGLPLVPSIITTIFKAR